MMTVMCSGLFRWLSHIQSISQEIRMKTDLRTSSKNSHTLRKIHVVKM